MKNLTTSYNYYYFFFFFLKKIIPLLPLKKINKQKERKEAAI